MKKLVIVAGAAGEIGTEYCKQLTSNKIECIGIVRNKQIKGIDSPLLHSITCDLSDSQEIEQKLGAVDFAAYDQIIYLHTIGVDKFEPRNYPNISLLKTIDPEIYNTNVNSFKYLMRFCVKRIRQINIARDKKLLLKIAIVAGVPDKYAPFVIESFCEAKYVLRQYIQSQVRLYPEWVSGLSINITSALTSPSLVVRPYADTTYLFSPMEVVDESIKPLLSIERDYQEVDLIKISSDFVEGYYENDKLLYDKWSKETGIHS